ncbi:multidrug effflux MFS transporter [Nocardioides sp. GY 10127]|uniref:multidrug effflux MFS transporter n=1 Tax=Nocardioides sp. GY 10127 TaxID=2569762 RepID=UPI0010A8E133|nr:multidrug effflux MFS transporter [Nocardioides sp. GY 10127]TIC82751.1 multidrug effflux MFS transporter [Nocardioides sp. GY 10127]
MTSLPTPTAPAVSPGEALPARRRALLVAVMGLLVALGPATMDLYLPAFPTVMADLGTTEAAVQLTLAATTLGFAVGQLVVGPLSDSLGRRRPLLVATGVHVAASLWVIAAPSVEWVMVGRFVQGLGAAGGGVVTMAMTRDLFAGDALGRFLARMALVTSLAPIVAPSVGALLLRVVDWRGIFAVIAAFGLVMTVAAALWLPETLPAERRAPGLAGARARYRVLLGDRAFLGTLAAGASVFTAMFAYLSSSSFLYQVDLGLGTQTYGALFACNALGLTACAQVSARLMRVLPPWAVLSLWLALMGGAGAGLVLAGRLGAPTWVVLVLVALVVAPVGGANPAVQVLALSPHGERAGTAGSLLGAVNFGVAGLVSPLVGALGVSALSLGLVVLVATSCGQAAVHLVVRRTWVAAPA